MMHFQLFNGFHATLDDGQSLRALGRKSECLICLLALSEALAYRTDHSKDQTLQTFLPI